MFLEARLKAGLTQKYVAEQLGVTQAAVSQWETGLTKPQTSLLPKIAQLYSTTIDELLK